MAIVSQLKSAGMAIGEWVDFMKKVCWYFYKYGWMVSMKERGRQDHDTKSQLTYDINKSLAN